MKRKFENFGKALRDIRKSRGYSQSELGYEIGVHSQFVSNSERGLCTLPKPAMKKLVKKLGLNALDRGAMFDSICEDRVNQEREMWKGIL